MNERHTPCFIQLFVIRRTVAKWLQDNDIKISQIGSEIEQLTNVFEYSQQQQNASNILSSLAKHSIYHFMSNLFDENGQSIMIDKIFNQIILTKLINQYNHVTLYKSKNPFANKNKDLVFNTNDLMCLIFNFLCYTNTSKFNAYSDMYNCNFVNSHWLYHVWNPNSIYYFNITNLITKALKTNITLKLSDVDDIFRYGKDEYYHRSWRQWKRFINTKHLFLDSTKSVYKYTEMPSDVNNMVLKMTSMFTKIEKISGECGAAHCDMIMTVLKNCGGKINSYELRMKGFKNVVNLKKNSSSKRRGKHNVKANKPIELSVAKNIVLDDNTAAKIPIMWSNKCRKLTLIEFGQSCEPCMFLLLFVCLFVVTQCWCDQAVLCICSMFVASMKWYRTVMNNWNFIGVKYLTLEDCNLSLGIDTTKTKKGSKSKANDRIINCIDKLAQTFGVLKQFNMIFSYEFDPGVLLLWRLLATYKKLKRKKTIISLTIENGMDNYNDHIQTKIDELTILLHENLESDKSQENRLKLEKSQTQLIKLIETNIHNLKKLKFDCKHYCAMEFTTMINILVSIIHNMYMANQNDINDNNDDDDHDDKKHSDDKQDRDRLQLTTSFEKIEVHYFKNMSVQSGILYISLSTINKLFQFRKCNQSNCNLFFVLNVVEYDEYDRYDMTIFSQTFQRFCQNMNTIIFEENIPVSIIIHFKVLGSEFNFQTANSIFEIYFNYNTISNKYIKPGRNRYCKTLKKPKISFKYVKSSITLEPCGVFVAITAKQKD